MLSEPDTKAAVEQGWALEFIYDLNKARCLLTVMPVDFPTVPAWQARQALVARARRGEALAIRALKLIHSSNVSRRST